MDFIPRLQKTAEAVQLYFTLTPLHQSRAKVPYPPKDVFIVTDEPMFTRDDSDAEVQSIVSALNQGLKASGYLTDRAELIMVEPDDVYARFRRNGTELVLSTNDFAAVKNRFDKVVQHIQTFSPGDDAPGERSL